MSKAKKPEQESPEQAQEQAAEPLVREPARRPLPPPRQVPGVGLCRWFYAEFAGEALSVLAVSEEAATAIAQAHRAGKPLQRVGLRLQAPSPGDSSLQQAPAAVVTEQTNEKDKQRILAKPVNYICAGA